MNEKFFNDTKPANVLFLGGSITEGAAATEYASCYASLTAKWLKSVYGENKINYINKGIGGTDSIYGLLRLNRDVIPYSPNLVFIEFAVNDTGTDTEIYVESIVRSLGKLPNKPYIIFLYTTNNEYTTPTDSFERIAAHYEIPQISLKEALKKHLNGANPTNCGYFADSVHPTDKGHRVYADEIIKYMSQENFLKKPHYEKEPLNGDCFSIMPDFIPSGNAKASAGRNHGLVSKHGIGNMLYSVTHDDSQSLELSFTGDTVAIEHGLHENGGEYSIYIDGNLEKKIDSYWENARNNILTVPFYTFNLDYGKHTIKIVTDKNGGKQVSIYNFITGTKMS